MKDLNKLALISAFRALGGSLTWPFIGFALYKVYRFSLTFVSEFYLIQAIITVFASLIGGILTDRVGRRKSLILSVVISSLSLFMASLTDLPGLVASLILLQTFFNTVYNVSVTSLIGDIYKGVRDLVKAFSRQRVGINAGWAFGPLIGGYVFTFYGFKTLLLMSSMLILLPLPLLYLLPEFKGERSKLTITKDFALFLIPSFFTFAIMGQLGFSLLTYYNALLDFSAFQVGILFAINGLLIVALQDYVGKVIGNRVKLIVLGMIIYGIGYFAVAFVTTFIYAALDIVVVTFAEMVVSPLSQTIVNVLADQRSRGRQVGLYNMVTSVGRILGSSISSELMTYYLYTPTILWGVISSFGFISAVLYYIILNMHKNIV
mgnify:CR=1 FL=1